ncbi:MAG TPA: adenylate/guanylate cyclase domain-containing protein [Methylomirabilota bacterium]|nr:adenylate/guanylate cyclase domain-containing protein [Methylomirabilota bacterium]
MSARRRYRELATLAYALAALVLPLLADGPTAPDGPLLDVLVAARAALAGPAASLDEPSSVAVIALDEGSLFRSELSAYPRVLLAPVWAPILDGLAAADVRAVGFDIILAWSASVLAPQFDRPLLEALARHGEHVVLARSAATLPARPYLAALRFDERALGVVDLVADPDGSYRRVPSSHPTEAGESHPSFVAALLRRSGATMPASLVLAPRRHPEGVPTYALADVYRCAREAPEALVQAFRGKVVLAGTVLPEEDRKMSTGRFLKPPTAPGPLLHPCGLRRLPASAPHSASVPGVSLHAAAVAAVLEGRVTATAGPLVVAAAAALAAAGGAVAGLLLSPWIAALAVVVGALAIMASAIAALARDLWIPVAVPLLVLVGAPPLAYVVRYFVEERARLRLQRAFGHYVSPTLVARLAQDPSALRLGGERREVTVMFADLSGFTALSGKVEPEVLVRLTNEYLGYIADAVEATGGYVDKFIGDAVMAIWGAPLAHPEHAASGVRAALAAAARVEDARQAATARGEPGFSVKIALNSGEVIVGNVGTDRRYNYTAVGETVNLASRLESVPGLYGCKVVLGPSTAALAGKAFLVRELDWIKVKGADLPLTIFEPLGERAQADPALVERARRFAEALEHYRAMRFEVARCIWEELARAEQNAGEAPRQLPTPAAVMAARARAYAAALPPAPWDGVWVLSGK